MKPFTFVKAEDLEAAKQALKQYGDDARLISGGQSLLNMMKMRIVRPSYVVSIGGIEALKQYGYNGSDQLRIGAGVTYFSLENSQFALGPHQMIAEVSANIADISVRNMATAGGAICQADPHSDFPALTVALNSQFELESVRGKRIVTAEEFFTDYYETIIQPDELLTAMIFPGMGPRTGWAFEKFYLRKGDYALASVACTLETDAENKVKQTKIVIGSTEAVPVRARETEALLTGNILNEKLAEEAGRLAMEETEPLEDSIFSSARYKKELVKTLTTRALLRAQSRVKE